MGRPIPRLVPQLLMSFPDISFKPTTSSSNVQFEHQRRSSFRLFSGYYCNERDSPVRPIQCFLLLFFVLNSISYFCCLFSLPFFLFLPPIFIMWNFAPKDCFWFTTRELPFFFPFLDTVLLFLKLEFIPRAVSQRSHSLYFSLFTRLVYNMHFGSFALFHRHGYDQKIHG
jgi:hypothetical protein